MGLSYAYYDEGAFRNINQDGDMRYAKEAIGLVNSGLNNQDKYLIHYPSEVLRVT